jgi:hypothetical protein
MRRQAIVLAATLAMVPLRAQAADLVVWWEKGFFPGEEKAVAEVIAAFEQKTSKKVELILLGSRRGARRPAGKPIAWLSPMPGKCDPVLSLLSFKAGLRAEEIAAITWRMVTDSVDVATAHALVRPG